MITKILATIAAASVLLVGAAASAEENPGNRASGEPASARLQADTLKNLNPRATVPGDRYCVEPTAFGLPYRAEHPYMRTPSQPYTPSNQRSYQPNGAGRTSAPSPGGYR